MQYETTFTCMSYFVTKYDINVARHLRMQCEAAYFMSYWEDPENTFGVRTRTVHVCLDRHELSAATPPSLVYVYYSSFQGVV
jgi:hypothetical protein